MAERGEAVEERGVRDAAQTYQAVPADAKQDDVPPGYKRTEVGVIPEDWAAQRFGSICEKIQDGTHFSPKLGGTDYLYVTSKNIGRGSLNVSNAEYISTSEHRRIYSRCDTRYGDLLLTKDGASTGNAALNNLDEECSLLSSVAFLRFDPNSFDSRFYLQYILSHHSQQQINGMMSGNAITRLTLAKIRLLTIPVPPFPEQHSIATALSDADALIESLDRLIAKKRAIKQAAMQQLLTGQTRLPGFAGEWETKRLGNLASFYSGGTPSTKIPSFYGGSIRWITSSDLNRSIIWDVEGRITEKGLENSAARVVEKGTLLLALYGATAGVAAISKIKAAINQAVLAIIPTQEDTQFIFFFLCYSKDWISHKYTQGGQPNLSSEIIRSIEIRLPELKEQTAIATALSDMDTEIEALERRRDKPA